MRIPRGLQLQAYSGFCHMMWQCHNKEFYLRHPFMKLLYLKCLLRGFLEEITNDSVFIHAYCGMDNHWHQIVHYNKGVRWLSDFMRYTHGIFGAKYNRLHDRSGKVANSRPKTKPIEDETYLRTVHFYTEANPIRAGKCTLETLKYYKCSSYRYYAYGIEDKYSFILTPPAWYLALGKTPKARQKKYRKLFAKYVKKQEHPIYFHHYFIGSNEWIKSQTKKIRELVRTEYPKTKSEPPQPDNTT